jgi:hypothetical protein
MPSLSRSHLGPPKSSKTNQKYRVGSTVLLLIPPVPRLFMLFCYPPMEYLGFIHERPLYSTCCHGQAGLCGQGLCSMDEFSGSRACQRVFSIDTSEDKLVNGYQVELWSCG